MIMDTESDHNTMSLEQLSGAVLKWEDSDGTIHKVEFEE